MKLDVTIPGYATGTAEIPTMSDKVRVHEDGKTIWNDVNRTRPDHPGVDAVARDGDPIVVKVGSGAYEFELEHLGN